MRYCVSSRCVLLRLTTASFMDFGADLAYLSCFPEEGEVLFPPLTYLKPIGAAEKREFSMNDGNAKAVFRVLAVSPIIP